MSDPREGLDLHLKASTKARARLASELRLSAEIVETGGAIPKENLQRYKELRELLTMMISRDLDTPILHLEKPA